jgi:hypothetical protein
MISSTTSSAGKRSYLGKEWTVRKRRAWGVVNLRVVTSVKHLGKIRGSINTDMEW